MSSAALKLAREKRRADREERIWQLINDPMVKRLVLIALITGYSAYTHRKANAHPIEKAIGTALPVAGFPLMAADAGVTDKWALAMFAALGVSLPLGEATINLAENLPDSAAQFVGGTLGIGPLLLLK